MLPGLRTGRRMGGGCQGTRPGAGRCSLRVACPTLRIPRIRIDNGLVSRCMACMFAVSVEPPMASTAPRAAVTPV